MEPPTEPSCSATPPQASRIGFSERWPVTDATVVTAGKFASLAIVSAGRPPIPLFRRGESEKRGHLRRLAGRSSTEKLTRRHLQSAVRQRPLADVRDGTLSAYPFDARRRDHRRADRRLPGQIAGSSTQQAPISVSATGVLAYGGRPATQSVDLVRSRAERRWRSPCKRAISSTSGCPRKDGARCHARRSQPDVGHLAGRPASDRPTTVDARSDERHGRRSGHPTAQRCVFRSDRTGGNCLFRVGVNRRNAGGASVEEGNQQSRPIGRLTAPLLFHNTVAPDGPRTSQRSDGRPDSRPSHRQTRFNEYDGRFSPNGKWIAYISEESGTPEVYVQPFPHGQQMDRLSSGGADPRWRRR